MNESQRTKVTLLSELSMQSNLLKQSLEFNLDLSVEIVPLASLSDNRTQQLAIHPIVLADFSAFNDENFSVYGRLRVQESNSLKEVLINCPKNVESSKLFKWRDLVGVFYVDDNIDNFVKGMTKILQNEMWLSRRFAQDYIQYFRGSRQYTGTREFASLTKREKQIIQLLGHGASNMQIADKLFVSENTVKTHLHNIFKKINAKNRLQALLWANNHI
ncbi:LuxR C-terminal-related transcriptional regulator [Vibrio genomosp. F10]|uniref:Helix-turn-helix transcriptional regulator n=1 Tax=Vibrio genomosp. F10 str. ZF-129 TaxID=1187848 RepID=A0A1E5BFC3_9VIBR|nr:LuxR C-terminal-related transcriptional regulator [Vibrio genomosp. F10]OEE34500.1 helix-turn-helix transcriptional regulator [Vibrio genomosp. F10 str. ZF-129]OEE97190.1 helix-turn-helix transcriptional regulator [Vibrio genomosp. F10 str. 9ZC157]OEF06285.1 helix-turn-helix transcriptional regulator [Vibrio genomosp. F10 str. 9ZB36]OEF07420.1 helix-turn-helix transcriptional regulator [Vibrio genomosp. F10 str. 9ZD137]